MRETDSDDDDNGDDDMFDMNADIITCNDINVQFTTCRSGATNGAVEWQFECQASRFADNSCCSSVRCILRGASDLDPNPICKQLTKTEVSVSKNALFDIQWLK